MMSTRQNKFSRLIQRELGEIFQRDTKSWFGKRLITVTEVRMSPDLSVAKVYLSFLMVDDASSILDLIEKRKSEIRRTLGNKIRNQVRVIPELIFNHDNSSEYASKIDQILAGLDIPKDPEQSEGE